MVEQTSTTVRWETTEPGTFAAGAFGENYFTASCAISPRNLSLGSRGYNKAHCKVDYVSGVMCRNSRLSCITLLVLCMIETTKLISSRKF